MRNEHPHPTPLMQSVMQSTIRHSVNQHNVVHRLSQLPLSGKQRRVGVEASQVLPRGVEAAVVQS